jgi:hypothetical protein
MTLPYPAGAPAPSPPPPESASRIPRFPWISLTVLILAILAVGVAIGLAVSAGIQQSDDDSQAMSDAVIVRSHETVSIPVAGPGDTLHVWVAIPPDTGAWRADGTLVYPDDRPFTARQDGSRLTLDDQLAFEDTFDVEADRPTLADGSTLVRVDDIHPTNSGHIQIVAGNLAPANELRVARDASHTATNRRLAAAGIVATTAILVGFVALIVFVVMLVRRARARPKRRPPPPFGGVPGYPGYPAYPAYQPYPTYQGYPPYPAPPLPPPPA